MYKIVSRGLGGVAALGTAGYLAALLTAAADGATGIQVPIEVTGLALAVIGFTSITSTTCWAVETIARTELRRTAAEIEQRMQRIAEQSHARTAATLRESITGDLMQEQLDAAMRRARTYGMVVEARMRGAANGATPVGAVTRLRRLDEH